METMTRPKPMGLAVLLAITACLASTGSFGDEPWIGADDSAAGEGTATPVRFDLPAGHVALTLGKRLAGSSAPKLLRLIEVRGDRAESDPIPAQVESIPGESGTSV